MIREECTRLLWGQNGRLLIQRDDIGRHNAVDKVFGYCLRNNVNTEDKALVIGGRISSGDRLESSQDADTDFDIKISTHLIWR